MLNGCLLAIMFVYLQIGNNKSSSVCELAMRHVTSSLRKVIQVSRAQ